MRRVVEVAERLIYCWMKVCPQTVAGRAYTKMAKK